MVGIKEFLNDPDEWHALVLGFAEGWFWWKMMQYPKKVLNLIYKELWYFRTGQVLGFASVWTFAVALVLTIVMVIKGVFYG